MEKKEFKKKGFISLFLFLLMLYIPMVVNGNVEAKSKVKLNKEEKTIYVGNTFTFKLNNASKVKWSSSNPEIASINNSGKVIGKKSGKAVISAKYQGKTYKAILHVKSAKLEIKSATISEGNLKEIKVLNSTGKVKWSSSDNAVAKINKNGTAIAVSKGKAKIKAKIQSEVYECTIYVVESLNESDFALSDPDDQGHISIIDCLHAGHYSWYYDIDFHDSDEYRGIDIGSTYEDVIAAYGENPYNVYSEYNDDYDKHLKEKQQYPRYTLEYKYKNSIYNEWYYLRFYFDANDTLIQIVLHK